MAVFRCRMICLVLEKKNKLGKKCWDPSSCQVPLKSVQRFQSKSPKCLSQSEAGWPSCFFIGPKNTNVVEDVKILLPVKFRWIPFSDCRGEVENVSTNQRPGCHPLFPITRKHKLSRVRLDLVFHQVPLNSVQRFQMRIRKWLSQSEVGRPSCFSIGLKNTNVVEDVKILSEEKSKMSQPIRGRGGHFVFPIGPKYTNLVEDVEILLPVKCRWIPFCGLRGEVENVLANQRPGDHLVFLSPGKHKRGIGR